MKPRPVIKKPKETTHVSRSSKVIHKRKPLEQKDMDRVIFVGSAIPKNLMKSVKKAFSEFGNIESIWFRNSVGASATRTKMLQRKFTKEGREDALSHGNFYIRYKTKEEAVKAIENMNMKDVDWKEGPLSVTFVNSKTLKRNSVHLRNLPEDITEKDIIDAFEKYDITGIDHIRLIRDRETGKCTGSGFVQFNTAEASETAIDKRSFRYGKGRVYIHRVLGKEKLSNLKTHIEKEKKATIKKRLSDVLILKDEKKPKKLGKKKLKKKGKKKSIMT